MDDAKKIKYFLSQFQDPDDPELTELHRLQNKFGKMGEDIVSALEANEMDKELDHGFSGQYTKH